MSRPQWTIRTAPVRSTLLLLCLPLVIGCGVSSGAGVSNGAGADTAPQDHDSSVNLPETTLSDSASPDTGAGPGGGFGLPCSQNADCPSEWCVEGPDGDVCSITCIDDCPQGWTCRGLSSFGSDVTFICVMPWSRLCWPCEQDADCASTWSPPGARCLHSDGGGFCGSPCTASGGCPSGYQCVADGDGADQCAPTESAECTCSGLATDLSLTTGCQAVSDAGACPGQRQCTSEGLSACDAPVPTEEVCDGIDNDCDGQTDGDTATDCLMRWPDTDGDGFGIGAGACLCSPLGANEADQGGDCNDLNAGVAPGTDEVCNFADDDCDGETDESGALGCVTWYPDADGDKAGSEAGAECSCGAPQDGWIPVGGDCDDQDPAVGPNLPEVCDGIDNNCDGNTDEENAVGCQVFYIDQDTDGFGQNGAFACLCAPDQVYTTLMGGDCLDTNPLVTPIGVEICNGLDDNCDGATDEDGSVGCGTLYKDLDEDGYGRPDDTRCYCEPTAPYTASNGDDCNDEAAAASPVGAEVCDLLDNDCNGVTDDVPPEAGCITYYPDNDNDTFGAGEPACLCGPNDTYKTQNGGDCNDNDPTAYPGAQETCAPADENCNGVPNEPGALGCATYFKDADGDGFGVGESLCVCADDPIYSASSDGDCYDQNADVWPGQSAWFTVQRGDGSFDYNCSSNTDYRWTKTGGGCGGWPGCSDHIGWASGLPDCAQWASWVTSCHTKITSCKKSSDSRQQSCH